VNPRGDRAIRAAVVGATGYAGSEVCRWLLEHPSVELAGAFSRQQSGTPLGAAVPALDGLVDLTLESPEPDALERFDAVFLATPHGAARELAARLSGPVVLDLSADHRHVAGWTYGLVEWYGDALARSRRIAVPGCFATAIALSVAPFARRGAIRGPVCVAAATGSTGAGVTPSQGTHHPERFANLRAYKVLEHQHTAEIERALVDVGQQAELLFVPWSAPVDRGIFATCFVPVDAALASAEVVRSAYEGRPLIRFRSESPEIRHVRGSAFVDLAVHQREAVAVVLAAIDNLGKGAAAQAIQCANLAFGLPVDAGLLRAPATP
jgi:N-acetyl-gamma-glutamyl-phosphate reductase